MKTHHALLIAGALGACTPAIPDSAAGIGFDAPAPEPVLPEAALADGAPPGGDPLLPPAVLSPETVAQPATGTPAPVVPVASNVEAPATGTDPGAEEIARQTAAALGLPPAPAAGVATGVATGTVAGSGGYLRQTPSVLVRYALSTPNRVGERIHSRSGVNLEAEARRNCAKYPSPEQAQLAFLSGGGPERDRYGLDPDGDGFACGWDPTPLRNAARN